MTTTGRATNSKARAAAGTPEPPALPEKPRPVDARVRLASWLDSKVRAWWVGAIVLAIIALGFVVTRSMDWLRESHLIRTGAPVTAVITKIGEDEFGARANASAADNEVMLKYDFQGQTYSSSGYLEDHPDPISLQDSEAIRVDPQDPQQWTNRTREPSLIREMFGAAVIGVVALRLLVLALVGHRRVMQCWRNGDLHAYEVVDVRHTALAPRSRQCRCTAIETRRKELVTVVIPMRKADPQPGDVVWLIHPAKRPKSAIAALTFA